MKGRPCAARAVSLSHRFKAASPHLWGGLPRFIPSLDPSCGSLALGLPFPSGIQMRHIVLGLVAMDI
jgi:hypothetical protein